MAYLTNNYFQSKYSQNEYKMYNNFCGERTNYGKERPKSHFRKEYSKNDLQWEWNQMYTVARLIGILSKDGILAPLKMRLMHASSKDGCGDEYVGLYIWCNDDSPDISLDFVVPQTYKSLTVENRIDWILRHFKVLPNVWYDDKGNPYIISGNAALREFNIC